MRAWLRPLQVLLNENYISLHGSRIPDPRPPLRKSYMALARAERAWLEAGIPMSDWLRPKKFGDSIWIARPNKSSWSADRVRFAGEWGAVGYPSSDEGIALLIEAAKREVDSWPPDHPGRILAVPAPVIAAAPAIAELPAPVIAALPAPAYAAAVARVSW